MKITLLMIGKTDEKPVVALCEKYAKRLKFYCKWDAVVIPDLKNAAKMSEEEQKKREGEEILKRIQPSDHVVLLDERGKIPTSEEFSKQVDNYQIRGVRHLFFVIGGAYGFSDEVYARGNEKLALSKMTFSHQMVRAFIAEQVYRAFTIINNEPYHHR